MINRQDIDLSRADWRKSTHSTAQGENCVEVARTDSHVAIRDSKCPDGPILILRHKEWNAFVAKII
ncbi:DUF397 domain-containing protein [Sphaerisporangium rhizosphaerae]|uniref:DUF397 domain-containing protein n=1 Tax=Sphaerisporangium rhizosphaerae TaxID=2269375 RepID=A0ABW2P005_9ACTN